MKGDDYAYQPTHDNDGNALPGSGGFNASRYLTKVSGSDYLEVKWRLLWLRTEHPDASIETEMTTLDNQFAVFKARISIPDGGSSTGWGSESYSDFRDFIEKAETKAIGRALGALGFGTQYCKDFDFGGDEGKVVDSPINFQGHMQADRRGNNDNQDNRTEQPATPKQLQFISAIARELNISDESLHLESQASFGKAMPDLSRRDASILIERLQQRRLQSARPIGATTGGPIRLVQPSTESQPPSNAITAQQQIKIAGDAEKRGWSAHELHIYIDDAHSADGLDELTKAQASQVIDFLNSPQCPPHWPNI